MKLFKKTAAILISLTLMGAMLLPTRVWAAEVALTQKVILTVGEGQKTPEYKAGALDQSLTFNVKNKGEIAVKNVKVSPIIDDTNMWPFEISQMNNDAVMDSVDIAVEKSANANWKGLKVRSDVGNKSYKLQFRITCDAGAEQYTTTKHIFVKALSKTENQGQDKPAETPPVESQVPLNPDPVISIANGNPVSAGADLARGRGSTPRVIVTGFSTDPGTVKAGSDFKLIVNLKNTSKATAVSNMLFDLQAPAAGTEGATEAPAFLPSSGSSTVYLDGIPAGGTKEIAIDLNARADLVQKPYSITMSMKYEDNNSGQHEATSSLAIPVEQEARFEFSDVEVTPQSISVGEEANVTCSLHNTGRLKLYNVKAKFEGEGVSAKEIFVGNVDSGATGSIDGILTAEKETAGEGKFKMVVTYEDSAGKASTVDKEFALTVAAQQDSTVVIEPEITEGGSNTPLIVGAIVALAGITAIVIIVKRRKKKKESLEEEDLLDEVDRITENE